MTSALGVAPPPGWDVAPLKHVTAMIDRGIAPEYVDDGPVRAVGQGANQPHGFDWSRTRFHDYNGDARKLRGYLTQGDVLVNSTGTGTLGRVGYFSSPPDSKPCVADGHVTVVRARANLIDARFSYYWLSSGLFQEYMQAALVVGATNQIELSRDKLGEAPTFLPPLSIQRRIAEFLDTEIARIRQLERLRAQQSKVLHERTTAALDELFCETEGAVTFRLKHLMAARPRYGVLVPEFVDEGVPFIRVNDLLDLPGRAKSLGRIPASLSHQYPRTVVRPGDLLLSVVGTVGRAAIAPESLSGANIARAVSSIRINRWSDPKLLLAWFRTSHFDRQAILATGSDTAQPTLGMEDLGNFKLSWPTSAASQTSMLARAEKIQDWARDLQQKIAKQRLVLADRSIALITAAVTGKIDISANPSLGGS